MQDEGKHNSGQKDRAIGEFDAWFMITRAITKYYGTFGGVPHEDVEAFVAWAKNRKSKE
jgi:hypothetical protein